MGNSIIPKNKIIPKNTIIINPTIVQSPRNSINFIQTPINNYSVVFYYNITKLYYFIEGYDTKHKAEIKCNAYNNMTNIYDLMYELCPYVDWDENIAGKFEVIANTY